MNSPQSNDSGPDGHNRDSSNRDSDKQPPMAAAMTWVSRITTVCLEMVLPAVGGVWLDERYGTSFWVVVGVLVGGALGLWHLLQLTKPKAKGGKPPLP